MAEGAFYKNAQLAQLPPIGLPEPLVPINSDGGGFHAAKYITLAIGGNEKSGPKKYFILALATPTPPAIPRAFPPPLQLEDLLNWNRCPM
ncbi:MAG: hypothetical protein WCK89_22950 [bacterium]